MIILSKAFCFSLSFLHTWSNLGLTLCQGVIAFIAEAEIFIYLWFATSAESDSSSPPYALLCWPNFKLPCPQNSHGLEPCFSAWLFASFKIMHICDVVSPET